MKTNQHPVRSSCANSCDRRSFLTKSAYGAIGIGLLSGLSIPVSASYTGTDKSKEEIFKQLDDLVDKYFPLYGTCSQTSCAALTEVFGIGAENVVKALAPFPGVALRGETCGAVSGCIASIALVYEDKQGLSLQPAIAFCSKFEAAFKSTRCNDILEGMTNKDYNLSKPEDYYALMKEGFTADCFGLVKKATHIAAEIIMEKPVS